MSFPEAFRQGLRDLGYVEGQNIIIEWRWAEGRPERLPDLAAELVRLKLDAIVTAGTPAIQAARKASDWIPTVMANSGDPVATGFIASLARPGGNIIGLSMMSPELSAKRLEILKGVARGVSRMGVLVSPANPAHAVFWGDTRAAARALGQQVQSLEVRGPEDFDGAFEAAARSRAGALLAFDDALTSRYRERIVALAAKRRLPTKYGFREFAHAGGLMAYEPHLADGFRRAAAFVDKVLKGAKPADLPV